MKIGRDAEGLITYYNLISTERAKASITMPPHLVPAAQALVDDRIRYLMLIIGPGSGKSTLLSQIFPSFVLGHDPTTTILGVSAGEALMQGFQRAIMETIEYSRLYKAMFPKTRPDKSAGWSTEKGLFVTGHEVGNADANFAAAGLDSKSLTGKHGRLLLFDDIHDAENSGSIIQCDKVWDKWGSQLLGRADPRGARYVMAGRRWNEHDIYSRLIDTGEWVVLELPAERENTKDLWVDVTVPDHVVCCFNEVADTPVDRPRRVRTRL